MAKNSKIKLHLLPSYAIPLEEMEREFNEMDARGWQLESYWIHHAMYRRGEADTYEYRVQVRKEAPVSEHLAYAASLEEFGIEYVTLERNRLIFRKKRGGTPFELFSDLDSRLEQAKVTQKNLFYWAVVGVWIFLHRGEHIVRKVLSFLATGDLNDMILWDLLMAAAAILCMRNFFRAHREVKKLEEERRIEE